MRLYGTYETLRAAPDGKQRRLVTEDGQEPAMDALHARLQICGFALQYKQVVTWLIDPSVGRLQSELKRDKR